MCNAGQASGSESSRNLSRDRGVEAPGASADFYSLVAELWEQGRKIDAEEAGFVLWSPNVIAHGPVIHKDGSRFLLNGRPQFLMGCQTYWGQNKSVTARSPLAFDRDFRQMRDYGFTWTRCFIPFKTEEDKRISDAIVQLAQKYGIVLYTYAQPSEHGRSHATRRTTSHRP